MMNSVALMPVFFLMMHHKKLQKNKLKKLIDASGNKVEAMWPKLFSKALKNVDISNLFGSAAPAGSSAAPAPTTKEVKKEDKKP